MAAKRKTIEQVIIRKSDGKLFRASYPDNWGDGDALAAMFSGGHLFYFRSVRYVPRAWYQLSGRWEDTGEIWEPDPTEFDVMDEKDWHGQEWPK